MKKLFENHKGFTLIEVVLVLAIGGLIFLLAFLAFQQVAINRRDTQRRSDAGRVLAEIQNLKANKGGAEVILLTDAMTSTADNNGICAPSSSASNVFTQAFYEFTASHMCKGGKFYSPSNSNYSTASWDSTSTLVKDQVRVRSSFMFGSVPVLATACKGTGDLPVGSIKIEIGLEKGVACRELEP